MARRPTKKLVKKTVKGSSRGRGRPRPPPRSSSRLQKKSKNARARTNRGRRRSGGQKTSHNDDDVLSKKDIFDIFQWVLSTCITYKQYTDAELERMLSPLRHAAETARAAGQKKYNALQFAIRYLVNMRPFFVDAIQKLTFDAKRKPPNPNPPHNDFLRLLFTCINVARTEYIRLFIMFELFVFLILQTIDTGSTAAAAATTPRRPKSGFMAPRYTPRNIPRPKLPGRGGGGRGGGFRRGISLFMAAFFTLCIGLITTENPQLHQIQDANTQTIEIVSTMCAKSMHDTTNFLLDPLEIHGKRITDLVRKNDNEGEYSNLVKVWHEIAKNDDGNPYNFCNKVVTLPQKSSPYVIEAFREIVELFNVVEPNKYQDLKNKLTEFYNIANGKYDSQVKINNLAESQRSMNGPIPSGTTIAQYLQYSIDPHDLLLATGVVTVKNTLDTFKEHAFDAIGVTAKVIGLLTTMYLIYKGSKKKPKEEPEPDILSLPDTGIETPEHVIDVEDVIRLQRMLDQEIANLEKIKANRKRLEELQMRRNLLEEILANPAKRARKAGLKAHLQGVSMRKENEKRALEAFRKLLTQRDKWTAAQTALMNGYTLRGDSYDDDYEIIMKFGPKAPTPSPYIPPPPTDRELETYF